VRMSDGPTTGAGRLLERSEQLEALDGHLGAVAAHGRGRLVLIGREAGIGKSALVRAFCEGTRRNRVLRGACDALFTPRPLGPLVDIADEVGGELGAVVAQGAAPGVLVAALGRALRGKPPDIVALEDLHWADEATLDVLRLLGRRIESLPALVLATYRDDEIDRAHPLRIVLGELPSGSAHRIALAPLSAQAVAELAGSIGVDRDELHRRTAGNPFFVTEVLAAADADIPATVRDAVLARAARLDEGARPLLDAVAIVPLRAEVWLLAALAGGELDDRDACVASGMLRAERDAVSFRHEIARVAVEEALSPHRRMTLHRKALVALAAHGARPDPVRLAHHAEAADDAEAVLLHAPAAGERAAMLGSHREAAAQFARALRYGADLPRGRRAELLERRSYECYLTNDMAGAIDARRLALEEHSAAGDRLRQGDAHRWLSRLVWFRGESATAESEARRAVELLEPLAPGRELAMAYSNMAQLRMLASDQPAASAWGERAIKLAERLGETEIVVHALNNDHGRWDAAAASATVVLERGDIAIPSRITALAVVGSLRARRGDPDPWAALDEAWELASSTGEVQRVALVVGARAEARWLAGENEEIAGETDAGLALALQPSSSGSARMAPHGASRARCASAACATCAVARVRRRARTRRG
jgi:tetratricopeptide (TPR) repeat protein